MTQAPKETEGSASTTTIPEQKAPLHTSPECAPAAPAPAIAEPTPSEREAKLKAEARAYALSGTTNEGKNYKRKLPTHTVLQNHSTLKTKPMNSSSTTVNPTVVNSKRPRTAAPTSNPAIVSNTTTPINPAGGNSSTTTATNGQTKAGTTTTTTTTTTTSNNPSVMIAGGPFPLGNSTTPKPPMPVNAKDYDPEYLKLIQSLGELDDFSIWDNLDNVDDEEFRLSDLEEDLDDDDDDDDEDDDDEDEDNEDEENNDNSVSDKNETKNHPQDAPKTLETTATASGNLQNPASTDPTNSATPSIQSPALGLSSPSLDLPGWDDNQEDGGAFYKDLEEELGSLLEEELEAAVRSLYTTKGAAAAAANHHEDSKKKTKLTKKQQQQRQQALPASAFVATTTPGTGTPVTAATLAAEAKRKKEREANPSLNSNSNSQTPGTPLRESARQANSATVTYQQSQQLRTLMKKHYQLLTQQAILSVRAAHAIKSGAPTATTASSPAMKLQSPKGWGGEDFLCGEKETDLTEILDLAVGMLQDLDQNRKDAIRTSIQLAMRSGNASDNENGTNSIKAIKEEDSTVGGKQEHHPGARRSLLSQFAEGSESNTASSNSHKAIAAQSTSPSNQGSGRLTRAAFRKLQAQPIVGSKRTAFDIPGLLKLDETFATIDDSVNIAPQQPKAPHDKHGKSKKVNILEASSHAQACRDVLKDAGANVEEALLPGVLDVSENFSQPEEHLGEDFVAPCTPEQEQYLRKDWKLFTSAEDNLVLRGVNLYGEKQWILIGDRYLPDRSITIISQRYSKLCVMLYKAHGIHVDAMGNLLEPPKHESVDDIDENKVKAAGLKMVEPPAILNVHRWSMEEDLTILKAVPIMGHMWAELGARLIPHRDRGHLRKRYQVLERRVKSTIKKQKAKNENRRGTTKARSKTPVKAAKTVKKSIVGAVATSAGTIASGAQATATTRTKSSPGRKGKKAPSPPKPKTTGAKATAIKNKGAKKTPLEISTSTSKNTDAAKPTSTSPMMSLETGAALLATLKPKEAKKPTAATSTAKSGPKASGAKKDYNAPYPKPPPGQHPPPLRPGDPRHPYYPPYVYDRYTGRYYIPPGYPYHPHPPPAENSKNHPPPSQNAHPVPPPYYPPPPSSYHTDNRKPISIASPKPTTSARPKDLDTPNSKSFLENIPKMVGEDFSALGGDGETSRQAYEKLMDFVGGSDEGLSRMQKMLENKDESEAAKAIVTHLAKSPGRSRTELPSFLDSSSNITGLSLLNEISKSNSKDDPGVSILARVLGTDSNLPKESSLMDATSMPSPTKKLSAPKIFKSPTKSLKADSFFRNAAGDEPETPKKGISSSSMFGTPLRLSPGTLTQTLRDSALLKDDGIGATTSIPTPFSPAPTSNLLKTEGLATNLTFPYSLAPSLSRGFDEKAEEDNRFSFDQDSRVCEDSNQLGDLAVGASLSNAEQPNGNSLSIPQEEFDAISGLGALSNSPFKTVKAVDANEKKGKKPATSFFRRVVGESKEKSPQKKLF